jgi:hypothetical protein
VLQSSSIQSPSREAGLATTFRKPKNPTGLAASFLTDSQRQMGSEFFAPPDPLIRKLPQPEYYSYRTEPSPRASLADNDSRSLRGISAPDEKRSVSAAIERLKRDLAVQSQSPSREERERLWLAGHREKYIGKWIALDGDKLLAVAATSREVFAKIAGHKPTPLVMQVVSNSAAFSGW